MTPKKQLNGRCLVKPLLIILAICLIVGYSGLKLKNVLIGPQITIVSPADGATIKKNLVAVKGRAERISQIYLNGRKVFTDEQGNFNEPYLLASGYNMLEMMANDQFGRKIIKKLQVTTIN